MRHALCQDQEYKGKYMKIQISRSSQSNVESRHVKWSSTCTVKTYVQHSMGILREEQLNLGGGGNINFKNHLNN